MRLNPVFQNELRLNSRSVRLSLVLCLFNLILAGVSILVLIGIVGFGTIYYDYIQMTKLYIKMAYIELALLLLFIPSVTAGSISGERERQTLEILLTTQMKPFEIVVGKLMSSLSMVLLMAVSSFPIISIIFVFGGIHIYDLFIFAVSIVVSAVFVGSIGIAISALVKRTTMATVMTYAVVAALIIGTYALTYGSYFISLLRSQSVLESYIPDIGALVYVFLINPIISFYGMISSQVGSKKEIYIFCSQFGSYTNDFVIENWVIISLVVQMLLSIILLFIAARKVNPLKSR